MTTSDILGPRAAKLKTHRINQRPPFERIALVLQGGGALVAYQGGVYQLWLRPIFIPIGSPVFRLARSIRR